MLGKKTFKPRIFYRLVWKGINNVYIKSGTPRLNGKVERSHLIDDWEFYQLLEYKGEADLDAKLKIWEDHYNFQRPYSAYTGKTLYESMWEKLAL